MIQCKNKMDEQNTDTQNICHGSYGIIEIGKNSVTKKLNSNQALPYSIREMSALTLLKQAKVPYIVDLLEIKDNGSIVLEKFDGDLFDTQPECIHDVVRVIYQLLVTMHNLNQLHIAHRDIKPDNILASNNNQNVALCDFGLSRYYSESCLPEQCTMSVQTDIYRSPELLFGLKDGYDPETLDVWSLGITSLFILHLEEYIPPSKNDDGITLDQLKSKYNDLYGLQSTLYEYAATVERNIFLSKFMTTIICPMLTIDPEERPCPIDILQDGIFDPYRKSGDIIDAEAFNAQRVKSMLADIPDPDTQDLTDSFYDHMFSLEYYEYENTDTMYLALAILCRLRTYPIINNIATHSIIYLAVAIADSSVAPLELTETMMLMKLLNYDLFLPVRDKQVRQCLDKLLSTV